MKEWSTLWRLIWLHAAKFAGHIVTLTGAIVSFLSTKTTPLKAVSVAIEPIQDLHGYDSPWPAGGGKNLFDEENATVYANRYLTTGNIWTVSSTASNRSYAFPCLPNTTYTVSAFNSDLTIFRACYIEETIISTGSGNIPVYSQTRLTQAGSITLTTSANATFIVVQINASITNGKVQIELGSTAHPFEPYSNICPISGFTEANIVVSPTLDAQDGTTYTVSFGAAGTVYGGTLDVTAGTLTVTHEIVDLSEKSWNVDDSASNRMRSRVTAYNQAAGWNFAYTNIFSNTLKVVDTSISFANRDRYSFCNIRQNYYNFDVKVPTGVFANAAAFKTWLANVDGNGTHAIIAMPIVEPQTYQLTPTEVEQLLGTNNVWADAGDVTVTFDGEAIVEPQESTLSSLNLLLGGGYRNMGTPDDVSDEEALDIILGGTR